MKALFGGQRSPGDYAKQGRLLSGKSENGYGMRPTEMVARAFESYAFDRLMGMGAAASMMSVKQLARNGSSLGTKGQAVSNTLATMTRNDQPAMTSMSTAKTLDAQQVPKRHGGLTVQTSSFNQRVSDDLIAWLNSKRSKQP